MNFRPLLFWACALGAGRYWYVHAHQLPPPGVVAPEKPAAAMFSQFNEMPVKDGKYLMMPYASYQVHARVLRVKRYRDRWSDLSPCDFVIGWGRMSDSAVYGAVDLTPAGRNFCYQPPPPTLISREELETHSATLHVIPANDEVAAALAAVRDNDVVRLSGAFVEVRGAEPGGLPRQACHVVQVTNVQVE